MTRKSSMTQAEIARAVRVGDATGKVAVVMRGGVALVDPKDLPLLSPENGRENSCDGIWGTES